MSDPRAGATGLAASTSAGLSATTGRASDRATAAAAPPETHSGTCSCAGGGVTITADGATCPAMPAGTCHRCPVVGDRPSRPGRPQEDDVLGGRVGVERAELGDDADAPVAQVVEDGDLLGEGHRMLDADVDADEHAHGARRRHHRRGDRRLGACRGGDVDERNADGLGGDRELGFAARRECHPDAHATAPSSASTGNTPSAKSRITPWMACLGSAFHGDAQHDVVDAGSGDLAGGPR